jgi:ABC-type thiamine transport system ATPase subunit
MLNIFLRQIYVKNSNCKGNFDCCCFGCGFGCRRSLRGNNHAERAARVDIAQALCLDKPLIVFDEFTSVVDREIAKVSAFAISKAVRRSTKQFIAVTCHYDVVDWLDPDWVFCTDTMEFSRKKEAGRPLKSKSIGAAQAYGRCFGNITI